MRQRGVARVWHVSGTSIAVFVALSLAPMTGGLARAQTLEVSPGGAIGLGNRGWSASEPNRATSANELEFSARAGAASDYIYRGTTLSDHGPAAGAAVEAKFGALYAGTTVATVEAADPAIRRVHFCGRHPPEDRNDRFRFRHDLFRLSRREATRRDRHQLLGGGYPRRSKHRRTGPRRRPATPILRTSQTPAPGANTSRPVWVTTCRAVCSRRTWAYRSPPLPAIRGSAIRRRPSAASRYPPISIGRRA